MVHCWTSAAYLLLLRSSGVKNQLVSLGGPNHGGPNHGAPDDGAHTVADSPGDHGGSIYR